MDNIVEKNYERWINSDKLSKEEKETLRAMNDEERSDAFFKDAEFGTGGMRAKIGLGTNRINKYVIRRVTIAFGMYLKKICKDIENRGVVISHDNRFFSRDFAIEAANILNEEGIKAYLFDSLRPTPELSYGVRYMRAGGGIMITASHNPKEYNGYKIYDETGCQLVPSQVDGLLKILDSLPNELEAEVPAGSKKNETVILPKEVDDTYCKLVEACQLNPDMKKDDFKIIYSLNMAHPLKMLCVSSMIVAIKLSQLKNNVSMILLSVQPYLLIQKQQKVSSNRLNSLKKNMQIFAL